MHRTLAIGLLVACLGTALALRGLAGYVLWTVLSVGLLTSATVAVRTILLQRIRRSEFPKPLASWMQSWLFSPISLQLAGGVLVACVLLAAGSFYGIRAQAAQHVRRAELEEHAGSGAGSMDAVGEIVGVLEPTQHSVGFPCRIQAVYGQSGLIPLVMRPTIWIALSSGHTAAAGLTKEKTATVIRFYDSVMSLHSGDYISVYIRIHRVRSGPFAIALLRRSITLLGVGSIYGVNRLRRMPEGRDLYALQGRLLELLQERLQAVYGRTVSGFLLAFSIGDRNFLNRQVVKVFAAVGIVHALVASGATIRMTVSPVVRFLRRRSRRNQLWYPVGMACTVLLVLLTGFAPPAVRAAVAYGYELTASLRNRSIDKFTGNVVALGVLMAIEPEAVFDPGILLSYCAVTVLAQLPIILRASILRGLRPHKLSAIISRGLAADIGITPLAAIEFGQFSLLSLVLNIVLYPFLEIAIPVALLLCLGGLTNFALGAAVRPLLSSLVALLQNGVLWLGALPLTHRITGMNGAIILYYGAIMLFLVAWNRYSFRRNGKYS